MHKYKNSCKNFACNLFIKESIVLFIKFSVITDNTLEHYFEKKSVLIKNIIDTKKREEEY